MRVGPGEGRILRWGDDRLRRVCRPAAAGESDLEVLAAELWRLMSRHGGVGLSAPQIGDDRRVVVVQDRRRAGGPPARLVLVNPELTEPTPERTWFEEGCLSFPGLFLKLPRPRAMTATFQDLDGAPRRLRAEGLLARVIRHEVDHLDGTLFVDHLSPWRRRWLAWRLWRLARG